MGTISTDAVSAILAYHGISAGSERLEGIVALLATLQPKIEELRAIRLSRLDTVIEPAQGMRWIERGGRSA